MKCKSWPNFRMIPHSNYFIKDNVTIGYNITFAIAKNARLIINSNVNLTQNILVNSIKKISIGEHTIIAENVSIRDGDHNFKKKLDIASQKLIGESIIISEDVWIGANCVILKGATINKGAVIGANSVILKKSDIKAYSVNAGSPTRFIKFRD